MIRSVQASDFRGLAHAQVDALGRLVVLVGPNGSGKTSLLEAASIAASPRPAAAAGQAVAHRRETWDFSRWLIRAGSEHATVVATLDDGTHVER
ncbi:MAG: AAA family ATPase [Polyangiaceae bacterium]|nr:AAA family ATPase [Polyangiaceae bacterium]